MKPHLLLATTLAGLLCNLVADGTVPAAILRDGCGRGHHGLVHQLEFGDGSVHAALFGKDGGFAGVGTACGMRGHQPQQRRHHVV